MRILRFAVVGARLDLVRSLQIHTSTPPDHDATFPGRPLSSTDVASVRISTPLLPHHFSRTFPSLANRNFRLLLTGLLVSGTGGWIQRIAQDWLVLTLTDSPTAVGITTACQFVPTLVFGLHAGLLADRLPKRMILLITQASMATTAAVLAVLALTGRVQVWHVFVLAAVLGVIAAV